MTKAMVALSPSSDSYKDPSCSVIPQSPLSWGASLVAQMGKNLPGMQETGVRSLVRKIPWRKKWQVFLPGRILRTEKPGGLQSMGSERVGHN